MTLSALGIFSAAGAGGAPQTYELIQSTLISTTGILQVDFANLPQTYRHLQVRLVIRDETALQATATKLGFNDNLSFVYDTHNLSGNGSTVISNNILNQNTMDVGLTNAASSTASMFTAYVCDILDYTSTTKNKVVRSLFGHAGSNNQIGLRSGSWRNTAAVTSVKIYTGGLAIGSRLSIYGIRG